MNKRPRLGASRGERKRGGGDRARRSGSLISLVIDGDRVTALEGCSAMESDHIARLHVAEARVEGSGLIYEIASIGPAVGG